MVEIAQVAQWYVKDLSKLTGVSVQTLHYYDRIGLLKPSVRLDSGYRVYSKKDLLKLQQIIALKFFGFNLAQIKKLLMGTAGALKHFSVQAELLEQKARSLFDASALLKNAISDVADDKSISWETIINLIEVYRMMEQLDQSCLWLKEILTPDELKQYIAFESELKTKFTPEQEAVFEKNWDSLIAEIKHNLNRDPMSAIGIALGKKYMTLVNNLYGKKYAHLRTKILEKGFGEGKGLEKTGLTPEMASWLEKATNAYWKDRIYNILNQVGIAEPSTVLQLWNEVLDDMYGEDIERKKLVCEKALADDKVSDKAKEWLKSISE